MVSTKGAGHPPTWKGGIPPQVGFPPWVGFPTHGRFWVGVLFEDFYTNSWVFHLYNEGQGEGARHTKAIAWPHPLVAGHPLSPNPSGLSPPPHPARLSEAPPDFSTTTDTTPSCCRIQEELLLPLPAGTGRWTSSSSTTERVTEYGGAARSWRRNRS